MIQASGQELDSTIFMVEQQTAFAQLVISYATALEEAGQIIASKEDRNFGAEVDAMTEEIENEGGEIQETYDSLSEMLGGDADFVKEYVISPMVSMETGQEPVSDEDYTAAVTKRDQAAVQLVDHSCGYQRYMQDNLASFYGDNDEVVEEEAWTATWKKLHSILSDAEGTLLAEVVIFFDQLAREKFGKAYKHIDKDRGAIVNQDVVARTFYVVMENHLARAIIGSNRDEWTGYQ
jgi:hypothetical protein